MPQTNRIIYNIQARDIEGTADFFAAVGGLQRIFTSDWYIVLSPQNAEAIQIGIIDELNAVTPKASRGKAAGSYLTLVVDNLEEALSAARALGAEIVEEPRDLDYGQRRALVRDPNGVVVDLSQLIES